MPEPTLCSIRDCTRPRDRRGWCRAHYLRWYRHGDPLAGRGDVTATELPTCSVSDCSRVVSGQGLCAAHYQRWVKYGDAGTAPIEDRCPGLLCSMDACDRPHYAKDLCTKHYQRFYKHGDPTYAIPARWQGDDVGYNAVHKRMERSRGRASTFPCEHCGSPARAWAYDHEDPDPKFEKRPGGWVLAYSVDPERYIPLCAPCHSAFDVTADALA